MTHKGKRFEACLLHVGEREYVVVEWDQLITVAEKSKLTVGSSVGYKQTKDKRQKPIRGTILLIGKTY